MLHYSAATHYLLIFKLYILNQDIIQQYPAFSVILKIQLFHCAVRHKKAVDEIRPPPRLPCSFSAYLTAERSSVPGWN